MTKTILLIGATKHGTSAESLILENLIQLAPKNCDIHCFGFAEKNQNIQEEKNYLIAHPFEGYSLNSLFYRFKGKIYSLLKKDKAILAASYILRQLTKATKDLKLDLIIAVAGQFSFIEAAYLFASKHNLPLKIIYFDPFTQNISTINLQMRKALEKKWLSYANNLYYNLENSYPENLNKKMRGFYIPIFLKPLENWQRNKTFLYGGAFYKQIRKPDGLYAFAKAIKNTAWHIECYSNLRDYPKISNIKFSPVISRADFHQKCQQAGALIYIGNTGGNSTSSKYLECIGYRKPIVGIQVAANDPVRKYKYYFDATDKNLIHKLSALTASELKNYDPFACYPERNGKNLAETLFS